MMKHTILILFLFLSLLCHGQSYKFFTTDRELSSSLINKIYQDRNGMIWIATEDGLNRYDGAKFITYKHDPENEYSLCHNYVRVLYEDSKGRLFVGTYNGIQLYDPETDSFSARAQWEDGKTFDSNIMSILERRNGEIWVSGNNLCTITITQGKLTAHKLDLPIPTQMTDYMIEDRQHNLWVTQGENGIYRLSADNKSKHFLKQEKGMTIVDLYEDNYGDIYLATIGKGLLKYNQPAEEFIPILYKGKQNLPIKSICQISQNELCLGTDGKGTKIFNIPKQLITDYPFDNNYLDSGTSKVHSVLKDNAGNLWIAIYQKGVMMIPAQPNSFKYIGYKSINKNIIGSNCITSLCRDHEGILWIGTDNDGIYGITTELKQKVHYAPHDSPSSVPSTVFGLYEDSEHNLWFGSYTNGLGRLDKKTGQCSYLQNLTDKNGNRIQRVYDLVEDQDKRLWIATMGAGLFYYDLKTGQSVYDPKFNAATKKYKWISCLLYAGDNHLYVGTYDGIRCIDLSTDDFKDDEEPRKVSVAGRMMSRRVMGKASFIELQDSKGRIQVYITRDDICPDENKEMYNTVFKRLLDLGDFIGIEGFVFRTQMGEISIHAKRLTVLSKSIKPLPIVKYKDGVAYDKFEDPELRYRQRYVDLAVNEEIKDIFIKRSKVYSSMREYFNSKGYMEVETPILQSIAGGAAARPFITHHNALDMPLYMRIASELYLKRLIVGGFEGVYEIGKNFRNEGMDRTHNPEFTCMEIYVAYKDYNWMMEFTEKMIEKICLDVNGTTQVKVGDNIIDFKAPYKRVTMLDSIKEHTGYDLTGMNEEQIREVCQKLNMEIDDTMGKGKLIDEIFGEFCEGTYIQPTFITDYPKEMSPLTKIHRSNPDLTERFELMVNGKELCNAYSELNDPIDQLERFEEQMRLSEKGDDEAMIIDKDFVRALEYGMPPTSGMGIGMDRLTMLMTGQSTIQEVLFFPQMRPEKITPKDTPAKFMELGISEDWVPVIQKAGYNLVSDMKEVNPQKLHMDICGINKKYKLELTNPTVDEVAGWIAKIEN